MQFLLQLLMIAAGFILVILYILFALFFFGWILSRQENGW